MASSSHERLAGFFKLLSDATRVHVLTLLQTKPMNVNAICSALGQSQPAVSHHLALLRVSGLIEARRDGKFNFYAISADSEQIAGARDFLKGCGDAPGNEVMSREERAGKAPVDRGAVKAKRAAVEVKTEKSSKPATKGKVAKTKTTKAAKAKPAKAPKAKTAATKTTKSKSTKSAKPAKIAKPRKAKPAKPVAASAESVEANGELAGASVAE